MRLPVASAEGWNLLLVSKESLYFFLLIADCWMMVPGN